MQSFQQQGSGVPPNKNRRPSPYDQPRPMSLAGDPYSDVQQRRRLSQSSLAPPQIPVTDNRRLSMNLEPNANQQRRPSREYPPPPQGQGYNQNRMNQPPPPDPYAGQQRRLSAQMQTQQIQQRPPQMQQPPPPQQSPPTAADAYKSAFDMLQSHRPGGSFYPEAHLEKVRPSAKSPDIISPRPQRLTPTMRDNLAQNLDQQTTKSSTTTPKLKYPENQDKYEQHTKPASGAPQLPPLDLQRRNTDDSLASSLYSQPSGVEQYLKDDTFSTAPTQNANPTQRLQETGQQNVETSRYNPPPQSPPPPAQQLRTETFNYHGPPATERDSTPPMSQTYNTVPTHQRYSPPMQQQYSPLPPQAPFTQEARPSSRPSSSQGRPPQQYPSPPTPVDYSTQLAQPAKQATYPQQKPYQNPQTYPPQNQRLPQNQRRLSSESREQYYPPPPQQPTQSTSRPQPPPQQSNARPISQPRPLSQDMSNVRQPPPNRPQFITRPSQERIGTDILDMPEPTIPSLASLSLSDPYPPSQPVSSSGPQLPVSKAPVKIAGAPAPPTNYPPSPPVGPPVAPIPAASAPVSSVPPKRVSPKLAMSPGHDDWEAEIIAQRENAIRTSDPNIALSWAEKVYMFVSISLEDFYRDQEISSSDAGGTPRPSTPPFERGLRDDCIGVVERFVKQGHPKAIYMRGIWFEYGDFKYPNDRTEAYHAYQAAVKHGFARAEYRLGKMYEDVGDIKRGIYHYERGVAQGDSAALYRMGMMTLMGQKGHPVNIAEGVKMLHQSAGKADLDSPQGAFVFALLLAGEFNGATVPEQILPHDERAARRMLEKAASLGFSHAQLKLGSAYENATWGCEYDPIMSLHYYTLAAKQGDQEAMMGLSKWYLCGGEGFSPNEEKAYIYAERAAKMGLPQAEFAMGYFNEVGIYVPMDLKLAESWYKRAADHGFKDAIQRREGISRNKTLSRKDHETITSNIRQNRPQKAPKPVQAPPPVPQLPQQYQQYQEPPRPPPPYSADPSGRSQSPVGRGRIPSQQAYPPQQTYAPPPQQQGYPPRPQVGHGRTSSGSGPQPRLPPVNSRPIAYELTDPPRKSSYSSVNSSSIASLSNAPNDGYVYPPPVRPQTGSRPTSQGSAMGVAPSTSQFNRPSTQQGLGPKTFQEMGVKTNHKKDSDCLVM